MKHVLWSVALCSLLALAAPAHAQRGLRGANLAREPGGVTPAEIQRMFDAYALLQAQDQLKISDSQFTPFLARFKALQDVRRQAQQQRVRVVMALRQLLNDTPPEDTQIREQLTMLDEINRRAAADARRAYETIDQVLDVRQQARFRIFEEMMERRKLDLVTRARLANRAKPQP